MGGAGRTQRLTLHTRPSPRRRLGDTDTGSHPRHVQARETSSAAPRGGATGAHARPPRTRAWGSGLTAADPLNPAPEAHLSSATVYLVHTEAHAPFPGPRFERVARPSVLHNGGRAGWKGHSGLCLPSPAPGPRAVHAWSRSSPGCRASGAPGAGVSRLPHQGSAGARAGQFQEGKV